MNKINLEKIKMLMQAAVNAFVEHDKKLGCSTNYVEHWQDVRIAVYFFVLFVGCKRSC